MTTLFLMLCCVVVQITEVSQSARRALLAGFSIAYTVATTTTAAAAVTALVTGSSSSIAGVLSNNYPGITVATPTVAQSTPAPTVRPSIHWGAAHVTHINAWLVVSVMSMVGTVLLAM